MTDDVNIEAERLGIVGSGAIACGLAVTAAQHLDVVLLARSVASATRAQETVRRTCAKLELDGVVERVTVVDGFDGLEDRTFVVEAIAEELDAKRGVYAQLDERIHTDAVLATTTSSLSVAELAAASGRPDRFLGFHVFNPVPRMPLVELAFPAEASTAVRDRALALCERLGKRGIEVADQPGFVVNRLLFPYLFSAVRLAEETGMEPEDVDACMTLGASHPMGPLALLDFVGLDVAQAIGESIDVPVPASLRERVSDGALGRKAGRGFYVYPPKPKKVEAVAA